VPSITSAGVLWSHWKLSPSGSTSRRAASPATSSGMKMRKPVAAASPIPSATPISECQEKSMWDPE